MSIRKELYGEMSRSAFCLARRLKYAEYLKEGYSNAEAARLVGVRRDTANVWRNGKRRSSGRNEAPGFTPGQLQPFYNNRMKRQGIEASGHNQKKHHPKFFSLEERVEIYSLLEQGYSRREISRKLGRHHSGISREINKNLDAFGNYDPCKAHRSFLNNLKRPKELRIIKTPGLWIYILRLLENYWSPMQISKHLKEEYPNSPEMHLSCEAVYRAIFVQGKGQLKEKLKKLMRQHRVCRKPRKSSAAKSRFREPMVNISQRPAEASDRAVPGHWEGDLIMGKGNKTAIGTLVERSTRFCILLHLPKGHSADSVQKEIVRKMKNLPDFLLRSLTWDQGSELALHGKISKELDMQVFFCDPHSPWQRGTNENTNGLLRQFFPKGTNLSVWTDEDLDHYAALLNGRPRMTLGWKSPARKLLEMQDELSR